MKKQKLLILTDTPRVQTGLGRICREISKRLDKDFDVALAGWHHVPVRHDNDLFIYPVRKGHPDESTQMQLILRDFVPDVLLCIGDLWDFSYLGAIIDQYKESHPKFKAVLWVTIDGEFLGNELSDTIRSFDSVISFSNYGVGELEKLSSHTPYSVVYPGVDHDVFKPFPDDYKWPVDNAIDIEKTFTILVVGQNSDRKNIPATIEAFKDFSQDKSDVMLFLVTDPRDAYGFNIWEIIKRCKVGNKCVIARDSGVKGGVDDQKLNLLYNMSHVLLNTAIGEGFGMPLLEAQTCNCVPMVTKYASGVEVVSDRGILLKVATLMYGMYGIKRAWVDCDDIVKNLEMLYVDWKGNRSISTGLNEKGREFAGRYTWDRTVKELTSSIDSVQTKERKWVKDKIKIKDLNLLEVVPSWGKNCGIAEYSKELSEAIEKENELVNILPSNDLFLLIDKVKEKKYNTVVLQHEYSFFQDRFALEDALDKLREMNVKSIVEFHTYSPIKSYNDMVVEKADEVIVHCDDFKDKLSGGEEVDNVSVIKLSCKEKVSFDLTNIKKELGLSGIHPVVGSFGFMRDQKGYHEVAQAIKGLTKDYQDIRFLLVSPEHEFGSSSYEEKFYRFIEDLGISERTVIVREYMDEEKLLKVLACADMFVLNYKPSRLGGGNSAAIKTLMRVQRPIIVSDTMYFKDLNDEVLKVAGLDSVSIGMNIKSLYKDPMKMKELVDKSNKFLAENSWDITAKKHLNIYSE
jgi:glycosyltransferase involved in cell wall biosynthesis